MPFKWEVCPGTPKHTRSASSAAVVAAPNNRLTPPPSMASSPAPYYHHHRHHLHSSASSPRIIPSSPARSASLSPSRCCGGRGARKADLGRAALDLPDPGRVRPGAASDRTAAGGWGCGGRCRSRRARCRCRLGGGSRPPRPGRRWTPPLAVDGSIEFWVDATIAVERIGERCL